MIFLENVLFLWISLIIMAILGTVLVMWSITLANEFYNTYKSLVGGKRISFHHVLPNLLLCPSYIILMNVAKYVFVTLFFAFVSAFLLLIYQNNFSLLQHFFNFRLLNIFLR